MQIVSREPDTSGQYTFFAQWNGVVPEGFVEATFDVDDFNRYEGRGAIQIVNGVAIGVERS